MSGHSKWANIRIRKGAQDAKRGKTYTRHARLIEMAARSGGDPVMNPTLRTAIENAKEDSVPNANIERAIKKGIGALKGEGMIEEILYAAYLPVRQVGGPGSVAILIECLTDNRNRTISHVRSLVEKHGGRWADSGSVQWLFTRKGVVIAKGAGNWSDALELQLIDAGAEDIDRDSDGIEIVTTTAGWPGVRDLLKSAGFAIVTAGLKYVPQQTLIVGDEAVTRQLVRLVEAIEEDDDVVEVFINADLNHVLAVS
ncbi:hypothetical protein A2635_03780 [Candidatus Peribacteria bacterium RIFCSPHIGHO2_01_FULL_51_9]|nr:MAG: hypothetical protein A2635_03780 [Candidatus Peribacteria bacterium RIFCSPHIGHO2_01_FULL_51_9]